MIKKIFLFVIPLALFIFYFLGCVPVTYVKPVVPSGVAGIYHRIEKGQTLWRICKIYDVDIHSVATINHISDATKIESGQLIFIPGRNKQQTLIDKLPSDDFIWPLKGKVISSFGQTFNNMVNKGINIEPYGNHDVVASRTGRVIFNAGNFGPFGKTIVIDHGDSIYTVYARNSQVFTKTGDIVQKGMVIAKAGASGRDKNVYLHFEVRKAHLAQNPYFYLP